jgi:hypothetical protein
VEVESFPMLGKFKTVVNSLTRPVGYLSLCVGFLWSVTSAMHNQTWVLIAAARHSDSLRDAEIHEIQERKEAHYEPPWIAAARNWDSLRNRESDERRKSYYDPAVWSFAQLLREEPPWIITPAVLMLIGGLLLSRGRYRNVSRDN